jgi:hypothetical protein
MADEFGIDESSSMQYSPVVEVCVTAGTLWLSEVVRAPR